MTKKGSDGGRHFLAMLHVLLHVLLMKNDLCKMAFKPANCIYSMINGPIIVNNM